VAGDGVNIAARLEPLAPPDGICISGYVREQIHDELGVAFEDIGEQKLKNIERPIHAFAVTLVDNASALAGFSVAKPVRGFGGRPAIAVLPFENMSDDPQQAYFADGIAEDILTRLAMWRWMPVIARNSSFAYRGKAIDLKQVGAALGARYILEGSVRRSGDRVRISGQLIDTDTGHHVWAERYDRVLADIFTLQDEITDAIVTALEPAVGRSERGKAQQKGTQDLDAWELYQRGAWYAGQYTRDSFKEAGKLSLAAAERDTQFSTPLASAAFVRLVESLLGWSDPAEAVGESYRLALAAKGRDPLDPVALAVFGMTCAMIGQHDAAIDNSRKADKPWRSSSNWRPAIALKWLAIPCASVTRPTSNITWPACACWGGVAEAVFCLPSRPLSRCAPLHICSIPGSARERGQEDRRAQDWS